MSDFIIENNILKKYTGPGGDVVVPDGVTEIGAEAFLDCRPMTRVALPSGVTGIGKAAFCGCNRLESIVLPSRLTSIGANAFSSCRKLTEIVLPDSVTKIGAEAFEWCVRLTRIVIPSGVTEIACGTFNACKQLQQVELPDGLTSICSYAFSQCGSMTDLELPDTVDFIGGYAFANSRVTVRWQGRGTVEREAFFGIRCAVLPHLEFAALRTSDARQAALRGFFEEPDRYTDESIRAEYVRYAIGQRKKILPGIFAEDRVAVLRLYAEQGKITAANFEADYLNPATEAHAAECIAFLMDWNGKYLSPVNRQKKMMRELTKDPYNVTDMKKEWSYAELPDGTLMLTSYKGNAQEVIVPPRIGKKAVTALGDGVFAPYTCLPKAADDSGERRRIEKPAQRQRALQNIRAITLPDSLTSIGDAAFMNCTGLESITIPSGVTRIGDETFRDCEWLNGVHLPGSVRSIGKAAFRNCARLKHITIPDNVTDIGAEAFLRCAGLADAQGLVIVRNVLHDCRRAGGTVTIPDGVTRIGPWASYLNPQLTEVIIPVGVTHIDEWAFRECNQLRRVVIPEGVTHIGEFAFWACGQLRRVTLPASLMYVGKYAFDERKNLVFDGPGKHKILDF
ncbi:MAG: leucine-rich repeat domain-containing protein [Clostridia bacterium]|nr:leucine-rich repeat domain-containing protein [Clostridia bacterium]